MSRICKELEAGKHLADTLFGFRLRGSAESALGKLEKIVKVVEKCLVHKPEAVRLDNV